MSEGIDEANATLYSLLICWLSIVKNFVDGEFGVLYPGLRDSMVSRFIELVLEDK